MRLLLVAAVALAAVSAAQGGGFPRFGAGCARADFSAGGSPVRAELCRAHGGSGGAVVVLHGCGGFSTFDHRLVTGLPQYGISTLDVDFFGPTPAPGPKGFCGAHGAVGGAFGTWVQIANDAGKSLRSTPGVRRVGIVGWSLGGAVAVAAAPSFAALAGFSTGSFDSSATGLPPTILLSGGSTDAIPLAETLPLYQALRRAHVPSELFVYPHGSHNWPGKQGDQGIAHAAAFLRRWLR